MPTYNCKNGLEQTLGRIWRWGEQIYDPPTQHSIYTNIRKSSSGIVTKAYKYIFWQ